MRAWLIRCGAILACLAAPAAQAQVTVDVAKITCLQFLTGKIAPTEYIAMWLSGYYNGKINNTVIDASAMHANADKVSDYCYRNRDMAVMDAAKTVLGVGK